MNSAGATDEFPPQPSVLFHDVSASDGFSRSLIMLAAAIVVTAAAQLYFWPHITDDAYISFRYAFHLASGQGLVFNPGEHVEGFSNPLWTLLLAVSAWITGLALPDLARAFGLLFTTGTLVCIRAIHRHFSASDLNPMGLAFLFLLFTPGFHVYATAGLEGPLLSFLLVLGIQLTLSESRFPAAALFGLAGITRPEGPLLALLWFLATVQPRPTMREIMRRELPVLLIMVLPIFSWQVFRLAYYGEWLPNTALAKMPGVFGEFIGLPDYVTPWIIAIGGPLVIFLWFVLPPPEGPVRPFERMCLALTGGMAVFVIYAGGDWMSFGRFIEPIWPVVALIFPLRLWEAWRRLATSTSLRFRWIVSAVPAAGIIACAVIAWYPSVESYVRNEKMTMLMRGTDQIAVGNWIAANISPDATIATGRLGGISYGAIDNVVWDWFGLTDAEEARHIRRRRPGPLNEDPVFSRKPDVIAAIDAPADWSYKRTIPLMNYLDSSYVFIISVPQGTYGSVDLWLRKSRIEHIFKTRSKYVVPRE